MERMVPHATHAQRPCQGRLARGAADPRGDLQHGGRAGIRWRVHLLAEPCRSRQVRLPRPARQRDCADHDRDGWPSLAADHLLSFRADEPVRTWPRAGAKVDCDTYATAYYDPRGTIDQSFPIPAAAYLKLAAVAGDGGGLSLFALNRDLRQPISVTVEARGFGRLAVGPALELRHADLKAVNTKAAPDRVKPAALTGVGIDGGKLRMELSPASWNVICFEARA